MVYLNGEVFSAGHMELKRIVGMLDSGAAAREAQKLSARDAFDMRSSSVAARPARRRPCTRRARAYAPAWWPSALAGR